MHAATICVAILFSQLFYAAPADSSSADPAPGIPTVEQTVEMVAVHHIENGAKLVGFFDFVQGSWTLLAHRDGFTLGEIYWSGDCWIYAWHDWDDECYRVIRARHWLESWEQKSPLAAEHDRPWFRRLLCPGLAMPRRAEQ